MDTQLFMQHLKSHIAGNYYSAPSFRYIILWVELEGYLVTAIISCCCITLSRRTHGCIERGLDSPTNRGRFEPCFSLDLWIKVKILLAISNSSFVILRGGGKRLTKHAQQPNVNAVETQSHSSSHSASLPCLSSQGGTNKQRKTERERYYAGKESWKKN